MDEALKDLVDTIINSDEYKTCIEIKCKMKNNSYIMQKINKIKALQKKYIRCPSVDIETELNLLETELNEIPLYFAYSQNLEKINLRISYINDELNDYFFKLLNEDD